MVQQSQQSKKTDWLGHVEETFSCVFLWGKAVSVNVHVCCLCHKKWDVEIIQNDSPEKWLILSLKPWATFARISVRKICLYHQAHLLLDGVSFSCYCQALCLKPQSYDNFCWFCSRTKQHDSNSYLFEDSTCVGLARLNPDSIIFYLSKKNVEEPFQQT